MKNFRPKNFILVLLALLFIASCNNERQVANPSKDARVLGVYIQYNDNSPNASNAVFTINQADSLIFNLDSLPYGTRVDSLYLNFTFASTSGFVINDTVPESQGLYSTNSGTTSRSVNFTNLVKVKNLATDGKTFSNYKIDLRVHKIDTYKHIWTELKQNVLKTATENQKAVLLNNRFYYFHGLGSENVLFTSTDAANWITEGTVSGLPLDAELRNMVVYENTILLLHNGNEVYKTANGTDWEKHVLHADPNFDFKALMFSFKNRIWAVAQNKTDKTIKIANSTDGINWAFTEKRSYTNFPVDNFASVSFKPSIGREKVIVIGGLNAEGKPLSTSWSAENVLGVDTLYWVNLQHKSFQLKPVYNAGIAYYGSRLLMLGGENSTHEVGDTIFQLRQSIDQGLTWTKPDSTQNILPTNYEYRTNASVIQDQANNSMYIIGGKSKTAPLSDVWKIKVNFYSFQDYIDDPTKY